jgi:membrane protein required for colicin V production
MPTYDLLMLLVLVAATLFGFWKGMAWQIASLSSLVLSYFAALRFSAQLAPVFGEHAPWNRFVAMLAIYIVTSFAIWTLFRLVSGVIDKVKLEAFDKQLGAIFGFAKGVLLCIAITFFAVTLLPPAQGEAIVSSRSGRYIVALLNKTDMVVPPEIHQVIDPYLEKVQQRLNPEYQANWPAPTSPAEAETQSQSAWPQINWPPAQPQVQWPQTAPPADLSQPVWPSQTQSADGDDPYAVPHEPKPFPGPYSAERAASGTF